MSSSSARCPPPRRVPPPPPKHANGANRDDDGNDSAPAFNVLSPVPPRGGVRTPITASFNFNNARTASNHSIPDLSRLLARKPPPPPPERRSTAPPALPRTSLILPPRNGINSAVNPPPTPPPLNLASKPTMIHDHPPFSVPQADAPSCLQCRDFSEVDAHATLFPRASVHSLEDLAHGLTKPFEDEVDKARVIFTWLHYNISYDAHSFLSGNVQPSTPDSTLASGLAVCEGYAKLFQHLGELIGLQVHTVSGHGKGYGYQPLYEGDPVPAMSSNHAWNCVLLYEEWHLVDPCWGAGVLNGSVYEARFAPEWFISSPVEFGRRHFPADPSFQLTPEQTTWEDYILAPEGPQLTSDFPAFGLHPMLVQPSTKGVPDRQFVKFGVSKRCEHMSTAEVDNYVFVISTTDKGFIPLTFNEDEGAWVANIFVPRDGNVTLYAINEVGNQDAKGLGIEGFNKATGRKPMAFKGLVVWSVVHL